MAHVPMRVALTGGIATGKSHCLSKLASLQVPVIDADELSRRVVAIGTPGLAAVVAQFGAEVIRKDGQLDRDALGQLVFADPIARRALESIIHPAVYDAIRTWFESLDAVGVADIPLLYETGRETEFDRVIVAACPPAQQLTRLAARGLVGDDARHRLASQLPIDEKSRRADYVIDTSGTIAETDRQVIDVWERLRSSL